MKEMTIEVRIAFKGEPQREELKADIAKAVEVFGYLPIEGINSTVPGVMELGFVKDNKNVSKPKPEVKEPKAKKAKAPKKPKAKKK